MYAYLYSYTSSHILYLTYTQKFVLISTRIGVSGIVWAHTTTAVVGSTHQWLNSARLDGAVV